MRGDIDLILEDVEGRIVAPQRGIGTSELVILQVS